MAESVKSFLSFPNPVNETAARLVAAMVLALTIIILLSNQWWLSFILAYGFLARVLAGPTISPMGLLATRILAPRIGTNKPVPGPPKRFAQAVGLVFSVAALIFHFAIGLTLVSQILLLILVLFAFLESVAGFCAGCFIFGYLIRIGLIPQSVCRACVIEATPDAS